MQIIYMAMELRITLTKAGYFVRHFTHLYLKFSFFYNDLLLL